MNKAKQLLQVITNIFPGESDLMEMANLDMEDTGIENVVIWLGMDSKRHYLRAKVSNIPNRWSRDNFTITIPKLKVIGTVDEQFITQKKLRDIKNWIVLNMEVIKLYEKGEIVSTRELLQRIKKI